MSNHDKELLKAEKVLENQVIKAYCCHHLKENFVIKFKCELTPCFNLLLVQELLQHLRQL
jgi:hypothetical protein